MAGRSQLLQSLIDETRSLMHRLKVAAEALHGQGETSAGRRGVLIDLARRGAMTVPALARLRPVSRQHIQALVNPMLDEGLVELVDNPAHRRSRLVRVTGRGRRLIESMLAREHRLLDRLPVDASDAELRRAAAVLRGVRVALEREAARAHRGRRRAGVRTRRGQTERQAERDRG
jgi:DNA-binding MarR family transcriptional regulator